MLPLVPPYLPPDTTGSLVEPWATPRKKDCYLFSNNNLTKSAYVTDKGGILKFSPGYAGRTTKGLPDRKPKFAQGQALSGNRTCDTRELDLFPSSAV